MSGTSPVHDFVAVGIGPFNLGLAALSAPTGLDGVFLESRERFDWHPGLMLDDATLQVPFLADLVTLADPTSPYSFLAFLKDTGRLYSFYIRESFFPLRREYNQYCQWVADRLDSLRFGQHVERIRHETRAGDGPTGDTGVYVVTTSSGQEYRARRLVLGTGTMPHVPAALRDVAGCGSTGHRSGGRAGSPVVLHSADYLQRRAELQATGAITVVGSGQSAAEIFADLLAGVDEHGYQLTWLTRSPRFFPMEYTKLTLEMTSPEYTAYFQALPESERERLIMQQRGLYKGISSETINAIFDALYTRSVNGGSDTTMLTATEVTAARRTEDGIELSLHHVEQDEDFAMTTQSLVLATGYRAGVPPFLEPIRHLLRWDERGRYRATSTYALDEAGTVFVQNGEEHTHGFVAPDLGMGAYRNSVIIAAMLGREAYPVEKRIAFQEFGVPDRFRRHQPVQQPVQQPAQQPAQHAEVTR